MNKRKAKSLSKLAQWASNVVSLYKTKQPAKDVYVQHRSRARWGMIESIGPRHVYRLLKKGKPLNEALRYGLNASAYEIAQAFATVDGQAQASGHGQ